jgi:hypothetical protein
MSIKNSKDFHRLPDYDQSSSSLIQSTCTVLNLRVHCTHDKKSTEKVWMFVPGLRE